MKIYTKTGDKGETSLLSGKRVFKHDPRIEAYGSIDELNSLISPTYHLLSNPNEKLQAPMALLKRSQHYLFNLGSYLACDDENIKSKLPPLSSKIIADLENSMDIMTEQTPELKNFILPGGTQLSSQLHIARSFCRRAERRCTELPTNQELTAYIIPFLNRLSDFLFSLARLVNICENKSDIIWDKNNL